MRLLGGIAGILAAFAVGQAAYAQRDNGMADPNEAPNSMNAAHQRDGSDQESSKTDYETQTAVYVAAKAAAEARKAAIEAEQAVGRAKIGTVAGQTAITGSVAVGTGTAKPEALLLVTRATQTAAFEVARQLKRGIEEYAGKRKLIVLTDVTELSTGDAVVFDVQVSRFRTLMASAQSACASALSVRIQSLTTRSSSERMAPLMAAGAVLDVTSKLGSYFMSDYSFAGVEFTEPSNLTAGAVVGALRTQMKSPIVVPAALVANDPSRVAADLAELDADYAPLAHCATQAKSSAGVVRSKDAAAAAALDAAETSASRVAASYEAFTAALLTAGGDQAPPLIRIIRQKIVQKHLADHPVVLLVTSQKAAALYTKKNLWTFLGGPPLYTMGGVSMVFTLLDPDTGNVIAAGAVAKHGGYRSVGAVERLFR